MKHYLAMVALLSVVLGEIVLLTLFIKGIFN